MCKVKHIHAIYSIWTSKIQGYGTGLRNLNFRIAVEELHLNGLGKGCDHVCFKLEKKEGKDKR